ncbi:MAG TPA: leucine--tRNA ligase [Candidatus Andersenbacteria bacterium]|nr:leucine--tRNA ligase [Candidatus Andersenbacteria bacterium]
MSQKAYNHAEIEKKWQRKWAEDGTFTTPEIPGAKKSYILDMFPYPSGEGLHVGHPKGYIATDVVARMKRMQGYDVLHPMGWDAFGLPAENFAIKNKIHPRIAVEKNIARFKEQLQNIGFSYDWNREINTTDPEYYKWTQWIFLQLYKKGLAYESFEPINWCPSCQTGLANEDLDQGKCERCGSVVEKRPMRQWMLKITDYAEQLLSGLETLEWPKSIIESQRNWIGKSEGAEIGFKVEFKKEGTRPGLIPVFTTRPDTLFGVTYLVLSPEHLWVQLATDDNHDVLENKDEVRAYVKAASEKTEIDRTDATKEKTGVQLQGVWAVNPANREKIPMYVADYVLSHYGTGAIMAVPAHDERDFEFAKKYNLPVKKVVDEKNILIDSGEFNGLDSEEAKEKITEKFGTKKTNYKLRNWVFSRQRYWGEPIPIIHCDVCGIVPVPEDQLPVVLPEVEYYAPTGTGESPLAEITEWVNTTCPTCGKLAKRETNTMPQWAGSSWYYLRYIDPKNSEQLVDSQKEKAWMPVDIYVGGAEHATRHLIYARFWHIVLHELGVISTPEPFIHLEHVGLILAEDGRKMSKRYGNVVNPDDIVHSVGADILRVYEMFMGPFNQTVAWSTASMSGPRKFIERVWRLAHESIEQDHMDSEDVLYAINKTIKKVTEDTLAFRFNTAISALMECLNIFEKEKAVSKDSLEKFILLLSPYAPHVCEELWEQLGHESGISKVNWPAWDENYLTQQNVTIPVQVNGKVRGEVSFIRDSSQQEIETLARAHENVAKYLAEMQVKKIIYIPNKLINFIW